MSVMFAVYNELGFGYKEKYYQKAIEIALKKAEISFKPQCPYKIRYKDEIIGRYYMDFVVEDKIVLKLKAGNYFVKGNINQTLGYSIATNLKLGILVNFTREGIKYKRILNIK